MDTNNTTSETRFPVQIVVINDDDSGRRLDNFLFAFLKNVPKQLIYKLIRSGQVRVDSGRIKPNFRITSGQKVRIPPLHANLLERPGVPSRRLDELEEAIRYEDESFLVLDKPSGLASHSGSGIRYGVIDVIRELRPHAPKIELAHRLDKETSGCLLIAKDLRALRAFQTANLDRLVTKKYQALLHGALPTRDKIIKTQLEIIRGSNGKRQSINSSSGKEAITLIEHRKLIGRHTLATLVLKTGRMHQIRAHTKSLNCPVAGDSEYGDKEFNSEMRKLGLTRLFLHSNHLAFASEGYRLDVKIPLPLELSQVLEKMTLLNSP
jgi:23S rRNA pseudouridine955/2504/2580 synthase